MSAEYEIIGGRRVRMYWYDCHDINDDESERIQVRARNVQTARRIAREKLHSIRLMDVTVSPQGRPRGVPQKP